MNAVSVIAIGIVAAILYFARRGNTISPGEGRYAGGDRTVLAKESATGLFTVKVVALEFDETGPMIFVNGQYKNLGGEFMEIDFVSGSLSARGVDVELEPFQPIGRESGCCGGETRFGQLVSLFAPVTFSPNESGLFRIPLHSVALSEDMAQLCKDLKGLAGMKVYEFDKKLGEYSVEGESLEKLMNEYLDEPEVRRITDKMDNLFPWRRGSTSLLLEFHDSLEDVIDKIEFNLQLTEEEERILRENVDTVIRNALREKLDLEPVHVRAVVTEH